MAIHLISSDIYRATGYGTNHPLGIARIGSMMAMLEDLGWIDDKTVVQSPQATAETLSRFHDPSYVAAMQAAETTLPRPPEWRETFGLGTLECPIFKGLWQRASTSVGGSIKAAELALRDGIAYHPAGGTHHGLKARASGFCYFNDPVFAVLTLLDKGCDRVLYVDLDAHHGDGVELAFAGEPRVRTVSIHEENRWPFTGKADDRGTGNACNLPVPRGFNDSELDYLMDKAVLPFARGFAPDAVVVTCGADPLAGDPLSGLMLSNDALWDAVMALTRLSPATVVLGGGGYNPWTVARCWAGLWGRLTRRDMPSSLPAGTTRMLKGLSCDLVDDEDIRPEWMTTLVDPRNDGPVRAAIRDLAAAVCERA